MSNQTKASVDWFMAKISRYERAYRKANFAFMVHMTPNGAELINAQLALVPVSNELPPKSVKIGNFLAQRYDLLKNSITVRGLLDGLMSGKLLVPGGVIDLAASEHLEPMFFRSPAQEAQVVQHHLHGMSISRNYRAGAEDDWLLRAAPTPYNGMGDLRAEFGLLNQSGQFEAIAFPPIAIDPTSRVDGEVATVKVRIAKSIPKKSISLGLMVLGTPGPVTRMRIPGAKLNFSQSPESKEVIIGTATIQVQKAASVCCVVSVLDDAMQWMWIVDPRISQNPHRVIIETIDPGMEIVATTLNMTRKKAQRNDHEDAVAALLWTLGFSTLNIGRFKALSDGPDVIAISTSGQVLVVECTTGGLKADNKLQNLLDRSHAVNGALQQANFGHLEVIPVLATSRSREEVEADVVEYERRGVAVFTSEDIQPALSKTITFPDSTRRFEEIRSHLTAAVQEHKDRDNQPAEIAKQLDELRRAFKAQD